MRIIITGAGGLLGSSLASFATDRHEVYSLYNQHAPPAGKPIKFDLASNSQFDDIANRIKPETIIHAAAMTEVDRCETEKEMAIELNFKATQRIAHTARRLGAHLIFVSTDYVFDGNVGHYREGSLRKPINHYGYTKLLAERSVAKVSTLYSIARASVIYGAHAASGKVNFALWLLESLKAGKPVNVLRDQYVCPTLNSNLAEMLLELAEKRIEGAFHLSGATRVSRYEFAEEICKTFEYDASLLHPISIVDMKWTARRPRDTSLNTDKAKKVLYNKPLNLIDSLARFKAELKLAC